MNYNAVLQYQSNKVNTSSPGDLTLMLYEGAIKFCNIAIVGIENKDISKANMNLIKAEKIVNYLRETLDFKYSVAKEFDQVYEHLYNRLVMANIRKDKEIVEEGLTILRDMRDTWKEIIKVNK